VTKSSRCSWLERQEVPDPPGRPAEVAATPEQQSLGAAAPERREAEAGAPELRASGATAWPERRAPIPRVHGGRAAAAGVRQWWPPGASEIQGRPSDLQTSASSLEAPATIGGRWGAWLPAGGTEPGGDDTAAKGGADGKTNRFLFFSRKTIRPPLTGSVLACWDRGGGLIAKK
jgi:hypothetical protein